MVSANAGLRTPMQRAVALHNLEVEIAEAKRLGLRSLPAKPFDFYTLMKDEEERAKIDKKIEAILKERGKK